MPKKVYNLKIWFIQRFKLFSFCTWEYKLLKFMMVKWQ